MGEFVPIGLGDVEIIVALLVEKSSNKEMGSRVLVSASEEDEGGFQQLQDKSALLALAKDLDCGSKIIQEFEDEFEVKSFDDVIAMLTEILKRWTAGGGDADKEDEEVDDDDGIANENENETIDRTLGRLISTLFANGLIHFSEIIKMEYLQGLPSQDLINWFSLASATNTDALVDGRVNSIMDVALQIPAILLEIFQWLEFKDKKNFRKVCKAWKNATLRFWRQFVWIRIGNINDGIANGESQTQTQSKSKPMEGTPITMTDFCNLFERNENGEWVDISPYRLLEIPFRRYKIMNEEVRTPRRSRTQKETDFWELIEAYMEKLKLVNCFFHFNGGLEQALKWIISKSSPRLVSLHVAKSQERFDDRSEIIADGRIAVKNESLVEMKFFNMLTSGASRMVFKYVPSLKSLLMRNEEILMRIMASKEPIELERIEMHPSDDTTYYPLKNYLREDSPKSVKHLTIRFVDMIDETKRDFYFQQAVRKSRSLETLELYIKTDNKSYGWYTGLAGSTFPNLKKLKLFFFNQQRPMKFDFGLFWQTPMLESLTIFLDCSEFNDEYEDGNMLDAYRRYIPLHFYSLKGYCRLYLQHLKEFHFNAWNLRINDVKLFSKWFPNLTHLKANIQGEAVLPTLEAFGKMKKLYLCSGSYVTLGQLKTAKLKYGDVEIIHSFYSGKQCVVQKGENGRVYFHDWNEIEY